MMLLNNFHIKQSAELVEVIFPEINLSRPIYRAKLPLHEKISVYKNCFWDEKEIDLV